MGAQKQWLSLLAVFALCLVGMVRDRNEPRVTVAPLRSARQISTLAAAFICLRCGEYRGCEPTHAQQRISVALARCGIAESSLPPRRAGESLLLKVSREGALSMAPFPAALSVALGVGLQGADLEPADWALAPGVGPVLGGRIHRWQMARKVSGLSAKPCTLESVSGVGPVRANTIRRFLGLVSDCAEPGESKGGVQRSQPGSEFSSFARDFVREGLPIEP